MVEPQEKPIPSKRRDRSPSYPGIDLEEALEKARVIYAKEGRGSVPVSVASADWDFRPTSSAGPLAIAALKKFGLLEDDGKRDARRVKLTTQALALLLSPDEGSRAYYTTLGQIALAPTIHREIWEQYEGRLPSDANLRYVLVMERDFSEAGARKFIDEFRKTIAFARLTEDNQDQLEEMSGQEHAQEEAMPASRPPTVVYAPPGSVPSFQSDQRGQMEGIRLPIGPGQWATLQAPFPVSRAAWERMFSILQAMEPGLVTDSDDTYPEVEAD